MWDKVIDLEAYFSTSILPPGPIRISVCETIENPRLFVDNHLQMVKRNIGKEKFLPYLDRLIQFKELIEKT
ncbi:MAG: hypothetical protein H7282_04915 [Cytophagaceae bacterium]|nr:hypothetical protein [Cytophagaceae bacterium]